MIEFRSVISKNGNWSEWPDRDWFPGHGIFKHLVFKINGLIYEEWDEEFKAALVWEKLQND